MHRHSWWTIPFLWGLAVLVVGGLAQPCWAQAPDRSSMRNRADALAETADSLRTRREAGAARKFYREARSLYRRLGDRAQAAAMIGDIGVTYFLQDRYERAREQFRSALKSARSAGERSEVAANLSNIGLIYRNHGQYERAVQQYRKALQLYRELGNREGAGVALHNIGQIQEKRGQYGRALKRLERSLTIHRELDDSLRVAINLKSIGLVHVKRGHSRAALSRLQEALELNQAIGNETGIAETLTNLGLAQANLDRHDAALESYRRALRINRKWDRRSGIAVNLNNVGTVLETQERYDEALSAYREALRLNRSLGQRDRVARNLANIGDVHMAAGRPLTADSVYSHSIRITEALIREASGRTRRDFLATMSRRYQEQVRARVQAGRPEAALRVLELGRTRVLAERLDEGGMLSVDSNPVPPVDTLQRALGPREAAVLYANSDTGPSLTSLVVTTDTVRAREITDSTVVGWARDRFEGALSRLRREEGALLSEAKGVRDENGLTNLVRLYRHDLSVPPERQLISSAQRENLAQAFYSVFIGPLADELDGVEELVIVPDGALAYLPFGTLQDWSGAYLIERWQVQYAHSLRVLHLLRQRDASLPSSEGPSLLALGGAVYSADAHSSDTAATGAKASPTGRPEAAGRASRARSDPSSPSTVRTRVDEATGGGVTRRYRQLGYGPDRWPNLSGTLQEVRSLGRIAERSTLLVGKKASEKTLRRLSRTGALAEYRALHFATHGFVVPKIPALSALVLSEVGSGRPVRRTSGRPTPKADTGRRPRSADGYLNMNEIAQLDLDADFVALSACETGLGRIYRGSGSVGLAQAFLRAGARSVAVSLWSVYDASTSRFMKAVYQRAWGRDPTWAEAMAQTKRAFIDGDYGERLRAPRFWAPFVHYGRDGR